MQVINDVWPQDPAQRAALMEKGPDGPIFMVNLLKFKDKADYDDGRETRLTGREAYQLYGTEVVKLLPKFGGVAVIGLDVTSLSLGRVEELWDEVAIACYPDRGAMVRMSMSPEWQAIAVHRSAGLAGQLNIETVLMEGMTAFPWIGAIVSKVGAR